MPLTPEGKKACIEAGNQLFGNLPSLSYEEQKRLLHQALSGKMICPKCQQVIVLHSDLQWRCDGCIVSGQLTVTLA